MPINTLKIIDWLQLLSGAINTKHIDIFHVYIPYLGRILMYNDIQVQMKIENDDERVVGWTHFVRMVLLN